MGSPVIIEPPLNGTAGFDEGSTALHYTAALHCGQDSLRYRICNDDGQCFTATVQILLICPSPICQADTNQTIPETFVWTDVLANNSPGVGDWNPDAFEVIVPLQHGGLEIDGSLIGYYSLNGQSDSIFYLACDEVGSCDGAWLLLNGLRNPPTTDPVFSDVLKIPTAISPNGDSYNDALIITGLDQMPEHKLLIYDRLGRLLYQTNTYNQDWDAPNLSAGTYYLILEGDFRNRLVRYVGHLTVVR